MYLYQFQIHIWAYIEKLDYGIWCCHVNRHMLVEKRVADVSPNIFPLFSCHPNNTHSQLQVSESELAVVPTPFLSPTQSQKKKKEKKEKRLCVQSWHVGERIESYVSALSLTFSILYFFFHFLSWWQLALSSLVPFLSLSSFYSLLLRPTYVSQSSTLAIAKGWVSIPSSSALHLPSYYWSSIRTSSFFYFFS